MAAGGKQQIWLSLMFPDTSKITSKAEWQSKVDQNRRYDMLVKYELLQAS